MKNARQFRTQYDTPPRVGVACTMEERRTKSEFAEDCDINILMARYRKTGVLPDAAKAAAARYGDFTQVPTFEEMQQKLIAASELFAALPAKVRRQFGNDPGEFISAAQTPEGRELLISLGLGAEKAPESSEPPSPSPAAPAPSAAGQAAPQLDVAPGVADGSAPPSTKKVK